MKQTMGMRMDEDAIPAKTLAGRYGATAYHNTAQHKHPHR
jgi:hypothetical protein